jgi:hypothetical protein
MLASVKVRKRRRALMQIGGIAASVAVAGPAAYLAGRWLIGPTEYDYGGIACSEVMPLMPKYRAEQLPARQMGQIAVHLSECPKCGPAYDRMVGAAAGTAHSHSAHGGRRSHRHEA